MLSVAKSIFTARKVMFLHVSVILFTGGGSAALHAGIHPPPEPEAGTPRADTPWSRTPRPGTPPAQCMLVDTVNERAVCILLECNLVAFVLVFRKWTNCEDVFVLSKSEHESQIFFGLYIPATKNEQHIECCMNSKKTLLMHHKGRFILSNCQVSNG